MARIVMLTNVVAPDKLGGLERYVRELAEAVGGERTDVVVVAKAKGDAAPGTERVDDHLTIVRYSPPSKRNPAFGLLYPLVVASAVRKALRLVGASRAAVRNGEVLVHGHFPVPMIPVLLARLPFVYTMHAPVFKELLGERQGSYALPLPARRLAVAALKLLERSIVRRANAVVTLSEYIANEVTELAGRAVEITRIPGGIDVDHFSPGPARHRAGEPVLFCARRLVERTGVELLVESMPRIIERLPAARLYISGDGPRRVAIEEAVRRLGLQDVITLLGRVSDADLLSWYRSADLVITPTLYLEGFGLSTAEALACGTPAVVTPAGANRELVLPVHPSLLAERTEPGPLAEAVIAAWQAVGADPTISSRARESIAPRLGWEAVAERHSALYASAQRSVLTRSGRQ